MSEPQQLDLFTGRRAGEYAIPAGATPAHCKSCGAAIVWTRTEAGRAIPLSLATVQERDGVRYALTHFADCEHAKEWSKKRNREDAGSDAVKRQWTEATDERGE